MPQLDADCYLGVNFVRAFRAVLDPDTDRLFCKDAGIHVELEVASFIQPSFINAPPRKREPPKITRPAITMPAGASQTSSQATGFGSVATPSPRPQKGLRPN